MEDIAPALYDKIKKDFDSLVAQDKKIQNILFRVNNGTATAEDIQIYSIRIGDHAATALSKNISSDILPDGKMYYNIAERTVVPQLMENYELVEGVAEEIQKQLNTDAGIGLNPVHVDVNQSRIDGFVEKLTSSDSFDTVSFMLNEPVKNFTQNVADEFAQQNAAFQAKAGLSPKITREVYGNCCDWCESLAGSYDYGKEPDDFYRKHAYCRCLITFEPRNGKVQNSHTKEWFQSERDARIQANKDYEEMYRRKIGKDGQEIIDKPTYNKVTRDFLKHGGIIIRGEEAERHLAFSHASSSYLPGFNAAFIRDDATVSDVLEEMYHAWQDRTKQFGESWNPMVYLKREIAAQEYLESVAEKYKIPIEERFTTKENLRYYKEQLRERLKDG